jgi:hypothetical protein
VRVALTIVTGTLAVVLDGEYAPATVLAAGAVVTAIAREPF